MVRTYVCTVYSVTMPRPWPHVLVGHPVPPPLKGHSSPHQKIFGSYRVKVEYRPEGRFQNRWN